MTAASSTESVDALLEQLLEERGDGLFGNAQQCRGFLNDLLGPRGRQGREEVRLLVAAVEGGVIPDVADRPATNGAARSELGKKLVDEKGLTPEQASWAVDAWSRAFARRAGLPTAGGVGPPPGLGTEPPAPRTVQEPVPPRREDPREPGPRPRESSSGTLPPPPPPPPPRRPPSEPPYVPPPPPTRRKRGRVIALTVLLLLGGGIAVGVVVASQGDEEDSEPYYSPSPTSYSYSTTAPPATSPPRPIAKRYSVVNGCLAGSACTVATFTGPGTTYSSVGRAANGDVVTVVCQTRGQMISTDNPSVLDTDVWNKLSDGSYISDMFVDTNYNGFSPELARC